MAARALPDGERRTITALFADIKGSMALIEDLDPEEARAIVDPALTLMMEAVHRYEGYVVQSTGDGIFAFFGAPLAHEDHPQRALYATLRMQDESRRFAETLRREKGINFQIRVGLNTGEMVLRSIRKDDLRTEYTPIGHSTSLAARMESLATPGSIVVSEHTYKLTEGYFEFKALGEARVKGISEPVRIYEVLGVGPLRTRLQVAARRGLVRFVGRQRELEQLRRAFAQAQGGHGQIVGVMGEASIVQMCQGLAALRATGAERGRPWLVALLAEVYGKVGRAEEGWSVLIEALTTVHELSWESELYRLKGQLTLQSKVQGPKSQVEKEAEGYFLQAIEIARRQSAKSLELRAVMSLSRLWQQQSKKDEARQMLSEIYGWFTEGFDIVDLKEAKALLEELS